MTDATDKPFQYWLSLMDDRLKTFMARLPVEVATALDYSLTSLDVLEGWLLEQYPTPETALQETASVVIDGAARYIGETLRKVIGGYWSIQREDLYGDMPVLVDYNGNGLPECPESLAIASIDRRTGTYVSSVFRNMLMEQAANERRASRTRPAAERAFQSWLSAMDTALTSLFEEVPGPLVARLDYSMASLDVLEAWLLERYPAGEAADAIAALMKWPSMLDPSTVPPLLDGASRYVGETFRHNVGGRWWQDVTLEAFGVYGELPLIIEFSPEPAPICPLTAVTDAIEERSGNAISRFFCGVRDEIPALCKHLQEH